MPKLSANRLPACRHHKASGQAIVTLSGKDFYLVPWKSKVAALEYDRLTNEWLAAGRSLPTPDKDQEKVLGELQTVSIDDPAVDKLLVASQQSLMFLHRGATFSRDRVAASARWRSRHS